MVRNFRLFLVLSLFAAPSLLANQLQVATLSDLNSMNVEEATLAFSPEFVRTEGLEGINLGYDKEGFFVVENKHNVRVYSHDTNKALRGRSVKDIAKYSTIGKFKVSKFDNGEYKVDTAGGLKGGGILGGTGGAWFGKALVHFIGHGTILIVASFTGPAFPATLAALEAASLPFIEAASNVAAVGFGIAGAVATGPV